MVFTESHVIYIVECGEREIQGDQEGCPADGSMVYYGKYRVFLNK